MQDSRSSDSEAETPPLQAMAGGVGHDLGNILTPMLWAVESLAQQLPPDSTAQEDIEILRMANGQAQSMLKDLLAVGKRARPVCTPQDANDLVQSWLGSSTGAELMAEFTQVTLNTEMGPTANIIAAEPQLTTALEKLIRWSAANGGPEAQLRLESSADETCWNLDLYNSGEVVPEEVRPQIFQPFCWGRVKGKVGSGLHLAVAEASIDVIGGNLTLESAGMHDFFRIRLPLAEHPVAGLRDTPEGEHSSLA